MQEDANQLIRKTQELLNEANEISIENNRKVRLNSYSNDMENRF